jgi:hypothetical protein
LPVTDAIEVTEIANKMLKRAGYSIYYITEVRPFDPLFWQVKAITYPLTYVRMKIDAIVVITLLLLGYAINT